MSRPTCLDSNYSGGTRVGKAAATADSERVCVSQRCPGREPPTPLATRSKQRPTKRLLKVFLTPVLCYQCLLVLTSSNLMWEWRASFRAMFPSRFFQMRSKPTQSDDDSCLALCTRVRREGQAREGDALVRKAISPECSKIAYHNNHDTSGGAVVSIRSPTLGARCCRPATTRLISSSPPPPPCRAATHAWQGLPHADQERQPRDLRVSKASQQTATKSKTRRKSRSPTPNAHGRAH